MINIDYYTIFLLMVIAFLAGMITMFLVITRGKVFDDEGRLIPESEYKQQKELKK